MEQELHLKNIYYEILQDLRKEPVTKIKEKQVHSKCNLCNFLPSESAKMQLHMRTHTGEKPYSCNQCKFKTSTGDNLRVHMRSHSGEKPYKCTLCNFSSSTNSKITVHLRNHNEESSQFGRILKSELY